MAVGSNKIGTELRAIDDTIIATEMTQGVCTMDLVRFVKVVVIQVLDLFM